MKLNQFRRFIRARASDFCTIARDQRHRRTNRHAFVIIICCCIAVFVVSNAAVAGPHAGGWIQLSPSASPPPRSYLAMTYDPVSGKIIMFGGDDGRRYLNDTWAFDGTTWTHLHTRGLPLARAAAQMAYDAVTQKVVLFGGFKGRNYLGDTWL